MVSARRTKTPPPSKVAAKRAVPAAPGLDRLTFPLVALLASLGVFLCALTNALSRATLAPNSLLYWIGLLVISVPILVRLSSKQPSYRERLYLVLLLGLALYLVKVTRDSIYFTFPDEFIHAFNADNIERYHHLYHANPGIPTTPRYPGLEGATSALMALTGLSSYWAGMILVGVARLTFMAALFFLFARLSGSARGAALGVAVYTGSSNFLFWGAQYSYESLSLPLMIVVLMALVERDAAPPEWGRAWTVPIVLGILAITVTHHLTSYALAVVFLALAIIYRVMKVERPNPWPFALLAIVASIGWLLIAARGTVGYLFPVLSDAIKAIWNTASGEAAPRTLFHQAASSSETVGSTPLAARAVALLAIALLAAGFFVGIRQVWARERRKPLVFLFCLAGAAFFGALLLRFAPAAWETGSRAGEFLFIGLAFVILYGAAELLRDGPRLPRRRLLLAASIGIVLVGGAISGWPWDVQLARPLQAKAQGQTIDSEPLALAEWARRRIPGSRFAAPEADARLLLVPGEQYVSSGQGPDIEDIVDQPKFESWQLPLLEEQHLPYVVADRRRNSEDTLRGQYFTVPGQYGEKLRGKGVVHKFAQLPVARVWDGGRIVLFDLKDRP
jgi:hypothetical protein